jgi:hypothetical protein
METDKCTVLFEYFERDIRQTRDVREKEAKQRIVERLCEDFCKNKTNFCENANIKICFYSNKKDNDDTGNCTTDNRVENDEK